MGFFIGTSVTVCDAEHAAVPILFIACSGLPWPPLVISVVKAAAVASVNPGPLSQVVAAHKLIGDYLVCPLVGPSLNRI